MIRNAITTVTLLSVALMAPCQQCEILTTALDYSGDREATPLTRTVMGAEGFGRLVLVGRGNGLSIRGTRELSGVRLWCPGRGCPGLIGGDYDWVAYNLSSCPECTHGIGSGGGPGRAVLWRSDGPPRYRASEAVSYPSVDSEGAYVLSQGGYTYAVVTGWPDVECGSGPHKGPALAAVRPWGELVLLQCLTDGVATKSGYAREAPPWVDSPYMREQALRYLTRGKALAGREVLNGLALGSNHYGLIFSDGFVRVYEAVGAGDNLRLLYRSSPFKGYAHYGKTIRADLDHGLLVTVPRSPNPKAQIWDIRNPVNPTLLSETPALCCYAAINYPYAWIAESANTRAIMLDITDPREPELISRWTAKRGRELYFDAAPWGEGFFVSAFAYGMTVDMSQCKEEPMIFEDGFESGDTSKWSGTKGE